MTSQEFAVEIGPYLAGLWTKMKPLTEIQSGVWYRKLSRYTLEDIKKAIDNAYSESSYASPRLGEITKAIRAMVKIAPTVAQTKENHQDRVALDVEDEMMAKAIAEMNPDDRAEWEKRLGEEEPWYFTHLPASWRRAVLFCRAFEGVVHKCEVISQKKVTITIPYTEYWWQIQQRPKPPSKAISSDLAAAAIVGT